jgi:hypothetical protein
LLFNLPSEKLNKPAPKEHFDAMIGVAQHVVDQGYNIPVTLGVMGKVYILVGEEQVRRMVR